MIGAIKGFFSNFTWKKAGIVGAVVAGVIGIGMLAFKLFC